MGIFQNKHDINNLRGMDNRKENLRLPDSPSKRKRNRHYHNYFRGYTEVRQVNERGRVVIQRYYTKPWKVSGLSTRNYWLLRLLYVLLMVASVALFLFAMTRDIPGNRHWIVAIPGMPAAIILVTEVVAIIQYLTVPRKMTIWDYESSTKHLCRAALASGIVQGVTALVLLAFALITQQEVTKTIPCVAADIFAAGCSLAIFFVERKLPYREIPNDIKIPFGEAHEIQ